MEVYENEPFQLSATDVAGLRLVVGGNLARHMEGWLVRRLIGHIKLPSGEVLHIRSRKCTAASTLTWAAYCDPSLASLRFLGNVDYLGGAGDLAAVAARLFAHELLRAASTNGLARHYERRFVVASAVRGRIDFSRMARNGGQLVPTPSVVWERTPNTPENRFLAAALKIVAADEVMSQACVAELPRLHSLLAGVAPHVEPTLLAGVSPLSRNARHLETAVALGRLLVRGAQLDEGVTTIGAAFLINIELLFERTVAQGFREAGAPSIQKCPVRFRETRPERTLTRAMELDLFVTQSPHGALVVDAKYKTAISSSNLQQMVTYCYLTGSRRAFLVVPAGHVPLATYKFAGPGVTEIVVCVVELNTDATDVDGWRRASRAMVASVLS